MVHTDHRATIHGRDAVHASLLQCEIAAIVCFHLIAAAAAAAICVAKPTQPCVEWQFRELEVGLIAVTFGWVAPCNGAIAPELGLHRVHLHMYMYMYTLCIDVHICVLICYICTYKLYVYTYTLYVFTYVLCVYIHTHCV